MITASDEFIAALAYSHESLIRVTIDGAVVPVAAGKLSCDWSRNVRRTGSLRVADDPQTPDLVESITTASVVVIEKGIRFLDRSTEYVTVATMMVQDVKRSMLDEYVDIMLSDQGQLVDDYPLVFPWSPEGANVVNAIKSLVEDVLAVAPTWTVDLDAGPAAAVAPDGIMYTAGTSRWNAVNELALTISAQVYAEVDGTWVIKQIRPGYTPVFSIFTGPGGVLVDATRSASRRDTFNAVPIEWGTADEVGGIVLVTDSNPTSPTYWDGPWGRKPRSTIKLPVITEEEATAAAVAELQLVTGAQSGLNLATVYNPLLEPGDVIGVTTRGATVEYHVMDVLEYDLLGATMNASTRVVSTV